MQKSESLMCNVTGHW